MENLCCLCKQEIEVKRISKGKHYIEDLYQMSHPYDKYAILEHPDCRCVCHEEKEKK